MRFFSFVLTLIFALAAHSVSAQWSYRGQVVDAAGSPIEAALVVAVGTDLSAQTDSTGVFQLDFPAKPSLLKLTITLLGFETETFQVTTPFKQKVFFLTKKAYTSSQEITVFDRASTHSPVIRIDPKLAATMPSPSGNFESILQVFGARSTSELSSQYSVRGGNFDENLVYVNDFEIYRPILARSGQQEGMSFIHSDMVGSVRFSAGGFEARYGDKLSSVLDVRYRKPTAFKATVNASFTGAMAQAEGTAANGKFTWMLGARYRTLTNLLRTLDTQGEYRPSFADVQSFLTYRPNARHEWQLLTSYGENSFEVVPATRETVFGTVRNAVLFRVFFAGKEITDYQTGTLGVSHTWTPRPRFALKTLVSVYQALERERTDVEGQYRLDQLDTDLGSNTFGQVLFNRGIGGFHSFMRNSLLATVANAEVKLTRESLLFGLFQAGLKVQNEQIEDRFFEWRRVDSAGFSVPFGADSVVPIDSYARSLNSIQSQRFSGFLQNEFELSTRYQMRLTSGIRFQHWTYNQQTFFSPRFLFSVRPWPARPVIARVSVGHYAQSPFFRELRDLQGIVNPAIRAQQSWQFLAGMDYDFKAFNRPFKLVGEVYYKQLTDVIPYEIDNVRVRYYATNNATAFTRGIDLRLNGEFVNSMESWISMSFMQTMEDLKDDFYFDEAGNKVSPGYIPRPTDQRFNLAIMFQDYLPDNPTVRVNLNLVYSTGLPFGPPDFQRYRDTLRMPDYRRVDIGFQKLLVGRGARFQPKSGWLKNLKACWLALEVFNLLEVNNTVSYLWVRDASGSQYAIPNYLTARIINFRIVVEI